jgi:hypothetical protein
VSVKTFKGAQKEKEKEKRKTKDAEEIPVCFRP